MASECELYKPDINSVLDRIKSKLPTKEKLQFSFKRNLRLHELSTLSAGCTSKWSRGKLYCAKDSRFFLVPTNHKTVNHLDLREHVVKYCDISIDCDISSDSKRHRYLEAIASPSPLVELSEDTLAQYYFDAHRIPSVEDAADKRIQWFRSVILKHYEIVSLSQLLDRWSLRKYTELVRSFLCPRLLRRGDRDVDVYRQYLGVVVAGCDDSSDVVKAISNISGRALEQYGDCFMTTYEHIFFRCHVERANLAYELFERQVPRQDVLFNAFLTTDVELMFLGLELEWKSGYFSPITARRQGDARAYPARSGNVNVESSRWPRKKDPRHPIDYRSFHSVEFYAAFSYLIIWTLIKTGVDGKLIELLRLLWRSIPTPCLPLEDMRRGVDFRKVMRAFMPDSINRAIIEPKVWALLSEAFCEDSSGEFRPRTLKHLSRCAVRRRIRSPEQIFSLGIPRSMKQYLLLES